MGMGPGLGGSCQTVGTTQGSVTAALYLRKYRALLRTFTMLHLRRLSRDRSPDPARGGSGRIFWGEAPALHVGKH